MKITEIKPAIGNDAALKDNVSVTFTGNITLTGEYVFNGPGLGPEYAFEVPNSSEQMKLPTLNGDSRFKWFEILNDKEIHLTDPKN